MQLEARRGLGTTEASLRWRRRGVRRAAGGGGGRSMATSPLVSASTEPKDMAGARLLCEWALSFGNGSLTF